MITRRTLAAATLCLAATWGLPAAAAPKTSFNVCWTIYAGWMPWGYASDTGIVKKWADKYGLKINVTQVGDYVECINQFTAGKFDAATSTTMDALAIPSVGGVDTTGVDIQVDWSMDAGPGRLGANLYLTHVQTWKYSDPSGGTIEYAGTIGGSVSRALPEWKSLLSLRR